MTISLLMRSVRELLWTRTMLSYWMNRGPGSSPTTTSTCRRRWRGNEAQFSRSTRSQRSQPQSFTRICNHPEKKGTRILTWIIAFTRATRRATSSVDHFAALVSKDTRVRCSTSESRAAWWLIMKLVVPLWIWASLRSRIHICHTISPSRNNNSLNSHDSTRIWTKA